METLKIKKPLLMHTKSAKIVGSNEDLLTKILLPLPVKSLIDFKLVSKQWHSIITNPNFCHLRSCRKSDPAIGLLSHYNESLDYIPFSKLGLRKAPQILKDFSSITIIQSCNGLLLCRNNKPPDSDRKYFVCNPTTKHFSLIPKLDVGIRSMSLAFDPRKSPYYHVVCVPQLSKNSNIQIYSSETGSWRICGDPFLEQLKYRHLDPVYWKGAIHLIDFYNREHRYFKIDSQVLGKIRMPPIRVIWFRGVQYFEESNNHLHLIATCSSTFNVYEMKSDYSGWFIKYNVDISRVVARYSKMVRNYNKNYYNLNFQVLYLARYEEENEKEPFLVLHITMKVVRYNLVSKTFQVLHEFVGDEDEIQNFIRGKEVICRRRAFQYIESLSCV